MKFLKLISQYKISIIVFIFVFFLAGFFITESLYNANQAKYIYCFASDKEDVSLIVDVDFYEDVFKQIEENNKLAETDANYKKISYAKIDYKSMLKFSKIIKKDGKYELQIQKKYFPNIVSSTTGKVNVSENRIKNYFNLILSYTNYEASFQEVRLEQNINPWMVGGICAGACTVVLFLLFLGYSLYSKENIEVEDNQVIYRSIFHKAYWKDSLRFINSVKKMCTISILFACMLLCKFIPIPSGFGSLGIGFTYLFFGIICWIYGPLCGLFIGFFSDILGYFINPGGIFFMGYT
ncbi:MAG: ECF transporter S component, partial [Anaeroplasmataceae bacterium]|nr:ECF transporter S component [Anaeroplasmataceae bacterium]